MQGALQIGPYSPSWTRQRGDGGTYMRRLRRDASSAYAYAAAPTTAGMEVSRVGWRSRFSDRISSVSRPHDFARLAAPSPKRYTPRVGRLR
jgi:hypothetical protein